MRVRHLVTTCALSLSVVAALHASAPPAGNPKAFASPLEWRALAGGSKPRFASAAVWDPRHACMLVLDGESNVDGKFDLYDDLWRFDPAKNEWAAQATKGARPPRRAYHPLACDEKRKQVWLFGGASDGFRALDDLWRLDLETWTWTELAPAGEKPGARFNASLHYDARRDRLLLHSGCKAFLASDCAWKDVWTYGIESNTWTKQKAEAPARWQSAAALAPELDTLFVHGGFDGQATIQNDTWAYQLERDAWVSLGKGFETTEAHSAVWDPVAHMLVAYGGTSGAKHGLDQLWAFDPKPKKWSALATKGAGPGARAYHVGVWNPLEQGLWVFGGTLNQFNDAPRDDVPWSVVLHR